MTPSLLLALAAFSFIGSVTPGPNNIMLMASGAAFGFRRTLPHMAGIALGFGGMILLVGLGLAGLLDRWPALATGLKAASVAYMLWFAWKILNAGAPGEAEGRARPLTLMQAALFQWVNPKAWALALTMVAAYAPTHTPASVAMVAGVAALTTIPAVVIWPLVGQGIRRFLADDRRRRLFNAAMAACLLASLWPVLVH